MSPEFNPYFTWLGIPPAEQPADYYRLLGLRRFENDPDVITTAAEKQIQVLRSSPYGERVNLAKEILVELKAARGCLSDPQQKAQYDRQLAEPMHDHAAKPQLRTRASTRTPSPTAVPVAVAAPVTSSFPDHAIRPRKIRRRKSGLLPVFLFCAAVIVGTGVFYVVKQSENKQPSESQEVARTENQTEKTVDASPTPESSTTGPADDVPPSTTGPENTEKPPVPRLEDPLESKPEPEKVADTNPLPTETEEPPEAPVQQLPVPDDNQIAKAERLVKEVFGEDIAAAQTSEQLSQLAKQLMDSALESSDDVAARYVLLDHARSLAVQAGSRFMIIRAVDTLSQFHQVDSLRLKGKSFHQASQLPLDVGSHRDLAGGVLALIDEAMNVNRYEIAKPLVLVVLTSAKKVQNQDLDRRIAAIRVVVVQREARYLAVQSAMETLKEDPDDPAANLAYGGYLCLDVGDWTEGLPLLAKSNDETLQSAITLDLAGANDASSQAAIGEAWFALGSSDESKSGYLARAHHWYSMAVSSLTGLAKAKAMKRLEEIKALGFVPKSASPPPTFGAASKNVPTLEAKGADLESLTKLEQRMVGVFEIAVIDKKTSAAQKFSARFHVDGKIAKEGTEAIGTWKLDEGSRIKIMLTPREQGDVFLRSGKLGSFIGLQTTASNENRTWQLKPVTAVAAWKVATVDNTHHKNFVLYSNAKVDSPFSQYTWSLLGTGLTIRTIHGDAGFTIQPDGQTLKGRWWRGGHFVGVRIKDPSSVKDFDVRNQ